MYSTFEEAMNAALNVIEKLYNWHKNGCVVTETKQSKNARKTVFGFRFNSEDSKGKFISNGDGSYSILYRI